jgi:branched-chain amino acid aminotransferase
VTNPNDRPPYEPPDRQIWLDGDLVPWADATVHVLSHSLQRGSLIFDYMSVHDTPRGAAVFRLAEHVERLLRSAELVGLPVEMDAPAICAAICETVRANPGAHSVKISAYLPSIEVDVVPLDDHVSIAIAAYDPIPDVAKRTGGVFHGPSELSLWIEKERRNRRHDIVDPQAKVAANYVSPMYAKWAARRNGYDDILLIDEDGHIAEGPTTNVFWFDAAGALRTPPERNVLLGVTRRTILDIAKHDGLNVAEEPIKPADLLDAPEVFVCGTSAGVWPVVKIDGQPIGSGQVGPASKKMRARLNEIQSGNDPDFEHWLAYVSEG